MIYDHLRTSKQPQSVSAVAAALGIHVRSARALIDRSRRLGMVQRTTALGVKPSLWGLVRGQRRPKDRRGLPEGSRANLIRSGNPWNLPGYKGPGRRQLPALEEAMGLGIDLVVFEGLRPRLVRG